MPASPKLLPPDLLRVTLIALTMLASLYALVLLAWAGVGTTGDPRTSGLLRYHDPSQLWGLAAGAIIGSGVIILAFWLLGQLRTDGAAEVAWAAIILVSALALNFEPRMVGPPILADGGWFTVPLLAPSYRVHLPILNTWLSAALGLAIAALVWRRRNPALAWGRVLLGIAGAALLSRIALGGRFSQIDGLVKPALWAAAVVVLALSLRRALALLRGGQSGSSAGA